MPVIIRIFGYKIYFFVDEGAPLEPIHVHISEKPHKNATKIWILSNGTIEVDNNNSNIPDKYLNRICKTVMEFHEEIEQKWKTVFGEIKYYDTQKMPQR